MTNSEIDYIAENIVITIGLLAMLLILISVFGLIWSVNPIFWKLLFTGGFTLLLSIGALKLIQSCPGKK